METSLPSTILLTGISGFVGGYLVEQCRQHYPQARLFGLYRHEKETHIIPGVVPLVADMTHPDEVRKVIAHARPDLIFHLAAQASVAASWTDPIATLRTNAEGAIHLLEALRSEQLAPRIVLIGSGEEYGLVAPQDNPVREDHPLRPINPYAISKVTQELYGYQYFVAYHIPVLRVRAFNQFGPRQSANFVIANFARQIALIEANKAESMLATGNLRAQRDFLAVQDTTRAYIAVAKHGKPGEVYNIGSGQAHSIEEMLHLLLSFTSVSIRIYEDPARLRPIDQPIFVADTTRLRTDTGWEPSLTLEDALRQTLDYWREQV